MSWLSRAAGFVGNAATLGAFSPGGPGGFLQGTLFGNSGRVDAGQYQGYTTGALDRNMQLQQMLMDQAQGKGPDLAGQMYRNTADLNARSAGSLIGSMKGVSPAAASQMIANAQTQANTQASGAAALARIQQQLQAQQLLGANTLGMSGQTLGYQSGANQVNADIYGKQLDAMMKIVGGGLNAAGGAGAMGGGAPPAAPAAHGGEVGPASQLARTVRGFDFRGGGLVPGKAKVQGDNEKNDTVPAALSPGEIVLPRTVAQGDGAPDKAKKFVEHLKRRHGRSGGYKRVIEARQRKGGE